MTLITRQGCRLCGPAREAVARVCAEVGRPWREVDLLEDQRLLALYSELVPVVLIGDDVHDCYQVNEERLRKTLSPPSRSRWRRLLRGGA